MSSGWTTFLKLTCWVCGTYPSTLERASARALVRSKVDGFVPHAQNDNLRKVGQFECGRVRGCYNPATSAISSCGYPQCVLWGLGHQRPRIGFVYDSPYQSTLNAVYIHVVPWSEFSIVLSYPHICSAIVGVPHRILLHSLPTPRTILGLTA